MALVINNNMMAATAARNLNNSYGNLSKSVNRLSSGLRINSAADDAAGLAIREMMRSDVTTLNQGVRNANDAISLIQTADGALGVIDEKLIRMKELAEQSATGTYTSTQRLIIDSEYQAMASEITRIANATDFNGIKLLDGNLSSDQHSGVGMDSTGKLKVHFGTGNDSAEDYYYIQIQDVTAKALGVGNSTNYKDMMATAKDDALNVLAKNFGSMKNGDATARAAYARMENATNQLFNDVEAKVNAIFTTDGNASVNFNDLFSKVDVTSAEAVLGTTAGGATVAGDTVAAQLNAFNALMEDVSKTRMYGSKEELDAAAKALYESISKSNALKGQLGTNTVASAGFAESTMQLSALEAVSALYDRAVIAADGASVPTSMTSTDFNKMSNGQRDAMKADVAMAFLNTMTNGSTVAMSLNLGDGSATSNIAHLNNVDATGATVPAAALGTGVLASTQLDNLFGKMSAGYAQAVGTGATKVVAGGTADVLLGAATAFTTAGINLSGKTKALNTIGDTAAGGYVAGNATTSADTLYGAVTGPNAVNNSTFSQVGTKGKSLANAYEHSMASEMARVAGEASLAGNNIQTQDAAQKALGALDDAILKKDNVRADLGAMQNRLENTITNLQVQAENLQAAESRISDVDVATEMTQFVKNQILTQSAVAMLSQANSMPQMAMQLIGG